MAGSRTSSTPLGKLGRRGVDRRVTPSSANSIVRTGPLNVWRADTAYQIVTASITITVTSGA